LCSWLCAWRCSPTEAFAACAAADEPPLTALTIAALRTASLEPARVRSLLRRARVSALLPQVTARVGRDSFDSVRDPDTLQPTLFSDTTLRWDVSVRLSLDRLIFDVHELRSVEAAGRLSEHRYALLERVAALWAERRQLGAAPAATALGEEAATSESGVVRCAELTAVLDALTGGSLTSRANSLPRAPPRR
jgi:hypothetical protein